MALYPNQVYYGDQKVMDISDSTVAPETLGEGAIAYDKTGKKITGTMKSAPELPKDEESSFGDEYEGKLLYVVGGALVPLALGPGLAIRNGTLYITGGGGGDVETGITVEADSSGVLRVYSGGVEILPTVDEDGVIVWPGVSVSVDASGTLIFKEELDGNS